MINNENTWDKLLKIKTTGRDVSNSDQYHYPYEPTPYSVLERLANSGFIGKKDVVFLGINVKNTKKWQKKVAK